MRSWRSGGRVAPRLSSAEQRRAFCTHVGSIADFCVIDLARSSESKMTRLEHRPTALPPMRELQPLRPMRFCSIDVVSTIKAKEFSDDPFDKVGTRAELAEWNCAAETRKCKEQIGLLTPTRHTLEPPICLLLLVGRPRSSADSTSAGVLHRKLAGVFDEKTRRAAQRTSRHRPVEQNF